MRVLFSCDWSCPPFTHTSAVNVTMLTTMPLLANAEAIVVFRRALPVAPVIFLAAWILYCVFLHPLRNIPGPFLAKFIEAWRTVRYYRGGWHKDILDLHRTYGPGSLVTQ